MSAKLTSPLEALLSHHFSRPELLTLALTHPSMGREQSYERLEFLGDAVLGLCVADMLYALFPDEREGALAKRKAALVAGNTLAGLARQWKLGDAMRMSDGEIAGGGRDNASNLENALEAVLGALYLDAGLEVVRTLVEQWWKPLAEKAIAPPKDPRSALQEWLQARGKPLPEYRTLNVTGEAHAPRFTVEVEAADFQAKSSAEASTKRTAARRAAALLLARLESMEKTA